MVQLTKDEVVYEEVVEGVVNAICWIGKQDKPLLLVEGLGQYSCSGMSCVGNEGSVEGVLGVDLLGDDDVEVMECGK